MGQGAFHLVKTALGYNKNVFCFYTVIWYFILTCQSDKTVGHAVSVLAQLSHYSVRKQNFLYRQTIISVYFLHKIFNLESVLKYDLNIIFKILSKYNIYLPINCKITFIFCTYTHTLTYTHIFIYIYIYIYIP